MLIAPIAFVSEHVETLVELDHDYAELAEAVGCPPYLRAPAPGVRRGLHRRPGAGCGWRRSAGRAEPARRAWLAPRACAMRRIGSAHR